jgi:hypothetical protein
MTRTIRVLASLAAISVVATACTEATDPDSGSYFISSDSPGGTSSVRASNGTTFDRIYSASLSPTSIIGIVDDTSDPDCWLSFWLPAKNGSVTLVSTGSSTTENAVYYQCTGDGYNDDLLTGTVTVVSSNANSSANTASFTVDLSGARTKDGATPLAFSGTVSASIDGSSGGSGGGTDGGGTGGSLNLACPGSLPSGYQCLSNGGQQAPGRYNIPALHGTWVEPSFEVCMTLNSNGTSGFRYKSGFGPTSGQWGALVNKTGQFQPTSGPYYVFTGSTDAQIKLLSFDAATSKLVGWGFTKGSCPW